MKKFTIITVTITAFLIVLITIFNIIWVRRANDIDSKFYRVEGARVIRDLSDHKKVNVNEYKNIVSVHEYDPSKVVNNDYKIAVVDDVFYQIEYKQNTDYTQLVFMDVFFVVHSLK